MGNESSRCKNKYNVSPQPNIVNQKVFAPRVNLSSSKYQYLVANWFSPQSDLCTGAWMPAILTPKALGMPPWVLCKSKDRSSGRPKTARLPSYVVVPGFGTCFTLAERMDRDSNTRVFAVRKCNPFSNAAKNVDYNKNLGTIYEIPEYWSDREGREKGRIHWPMEFMLVSLITQDKRKIAGLVQNRYMECFPMTLEDLDNSNSEDLHAAYQAAVTTAGILGSLRIQPKMIKAPDFGVYKDETLDDSDSDEDDSDKEDVTSVEYFQTNMPGFDKAVHANKSLDKIINGSGSANATDTSLPDQSTTAPTAAKFHGGGFHHGGGGFHHHHHHHPRYWRNGVGVYYDPLVYDMPPNYGYYSRPYNPTFTFGIGAPRDPSSKDYPPPHDVNTLENIAIGCNCNGNSSHFINTCIQAIRKPSKTNPKVRFCLIEIDSQGELVIKAKLPKNYNPEGLLKGDIPLEFVNQVPLCDKKAAKKEAVNKLKKKADMSTNNDHWYLGNNQPESFAKNNTNFSLRSQTPNTAPLLLEKFAISRKQREEEEEENYSSDDDYLVA